MNQNQLGSAALEMILTPLFFAIPCGLILYFGLWLRRKIRSVKAGAKLYQATVGESVLFNAIPYPIIKFNDSSGLEVEWPGYFVFVLGRGMTGSSVNVLYDPENPSMILRSGFPYQIFPWFLIIIGAFFMFNLALGILVILVTS